MIVTDYESYNASGEKKIGYDMDGFLAQNLMGIPGYLDKSYDAVGIVSGRGLVRIGKCQPGGSKVLMSNGSWENIEDMKMGDEVISPMNDNEFAKVIETSNYFSEENYAFHDLKGNKLFECSANHLVPVYSTVNKVKKRTLKNKLAKDLFKKGRKYNLISFIDGHFAEIPFVMFKTEPKQVYGITLDSKSQLYITDNFVLSHNSTMAQQIGYFVAWILSGGRMEYDPLKHVKNYNTGWVVTKKPTKKVHFSIENLVFTPDELISKAEELYKKYGKHQVIVYDEGRMGLESARSMESVNKGMADFFQECGMYGHFILIVLPNFFKLHEDYSVSRSLFLVDVYARGMQRGYFNFYNIKEKEKLYFLGKKRIGITMKYYGSKPNFSGRFNDFSTVDPEIYEKAKRAGLKSKQIKNKEMRWRRQRDALCYLLYRSSGWTLEEIAEQMKLITGIPTNDKGIKLMIKNVTHQDVNDKSEGFI